MCGITGWVDYERDLTGEVEVLHKMKEALYRRGPDAAGTWFFTRAALGHRRLIVVDPLGGEQPMVRQRGDRTFVITYNGELYNTMEIKMELESLGYKFQSINSDTETLLLAYMEWGSACLDRLNGIFAFAVWDDQKEELFLARDRLGVKPLFYVKWGRSFIFASEPKALLKHPQVQPELDAEGLAELFAMGPSRTPGHGIFKCMAEVRPGEYLVYSRRGLKKSSYWKLESREHRDSQEKTADYLKWLLEDTVERQLVSDVPVCTFLSGGLDSSILTTIAVKAMKKKEVVPLNTYSVDYRDNDYYFKSSYFQPDSDNYWIDYVSESLGTEHHRITLEINALSKALLPAMRARDWPGMADIDSSLYLFCNEIKKSSTVALSGEAADEIFGGYPWFRSEKALTYGTFPWIRNFEEKIKLLSPELVEKIKPGNYLNARYDETLKEVPRYPGDSQLDARRREIFYMNIVWFMTTLLDRKDRMSMANGLEVRVPFCDHRIVEYVWNIPWETKTWGDREKGILRRAVDGVVPSQVVYRPKSPYPKTHNPEYLAAIKAWLLRLLNDTDSPLQDLMNTNRIRFLLSADSDKIDLPWFGQLMNKTQLFAYLIQLDAWLREYKIKIKV